MAACGVVEGLRARRGVATILARAVEAGQRLSCEGLHFHADGAFHGALGRLTLVPAPVCAVQRHCGETVRSMLRQATFSGCGRFRYRLGRRWGHGPPLLFVMLNPSTADDRGDDATVRRCLDFAQDAGFGALQVVNLFAYRATHPAVLRAAGYPVGPENDVHIAAAVHDSAAVCAAWGARAARLTRAEDVLDLLDRLAVRVLCLGLTCDGCPQHPLRLPSSCGLKPFPRAGHGDRGSAMCGARLGMRRS